MSLPSSIFAVGEKKNMPVCFHAVGVVLASVHSLPACGLPPASGPTSSTELANGNTSALMRSITDRSLLLGRDLDRDVDRDVGEHLAAVGHVDRAGHARLIEHEVLRRS